MMNFFTKRRKRRSARLCTLLLLIQIALFLCFTEKSKELLHAIISEGITGKELIPPAKTYDLVVYNRVPKCASTSMRVLLAKLEKHNEGSFRLILENLPHLSQMLQPENQKSLAEKWSKERKPAVIIRHLHYLDFKKFGLDQPAYINVVREPIDHFVSSYYFNRFGFVGWSKAKVEKWLQILPDEERFMSINECVMRNATECVAKNPANIIAFFCGHDPRCRTYDDWSLNEAKKNVERSYVVVGIAEDLKNTVRLFEKVLPRQFKDFSALYAEEKDALPNTRTARKVDPTKIATERLRDALRYEIEFYYFIKGRFYRQLLDT